MGWKCDDDVPPYELGLEQMEPQAITKPEEKKVLAIEYSPHMESLVLKTTEDRIEDDMMLALTDGQP